MKPARSASSDDAGKDPLVRLRHILDNIDGIADTTAMLQFSTILEVYSLIRTVERGLQIVSEAAKALPEDITALEPNIP